MRGLWLRFVSLLRFGAAAREGRAQPRISTKTAESDARRSLRSWYWAIAAGAAIVVLHLVLFPPLPRLVSDFPAVGDIASEEIRAPIAFEAPFLESEVEAQRHVEALTEPPVLHWEQLQPGNGARERFAAFGDSLRSMLSNPLISLEEMTSRLSLTFPVLGAGDLQRALTYDDHAAMLTAMSEVLQSVLANGVVDRLPYGTYVKVRLVADETETLLDREKVSDQVDVGSRVFDQLKNAGMPLADIDWMSSLLRHFVVTNLRHDSTETRIRQNIARSTVPTTHEFIVGERIVDRGERVTEEKAVYLERLNALLSERGSSASTGERFARFLTRILLLGLALGMYGWLGSVHFPLVLRRHRFLWALTASMALFLCGAAFTLGRLGLGTFGVPIAMLSLLTTVLFKDRVGYSTTVLAVSLLGLLPEISAIAYFVLLVLGVVTVVAVRRIRRRAQFYQTIGLLILTSVFLTAVTRAVAGEALIGNGTVYFVAIGTSILSVFIVLFLLPVVEPAVGVSSDLTLLELSDLNHPLLKRLALEAQGTYHHSQVVSQLAEQAARAINANSLLTRVGGLFHDIGKLAKPTYYVENQRVGDNKHDELSPSMSALVISAHVKDGIELGRRWRLPQAVIDFIPEHHGTNVMEYFYHKALEGDGNETVKVDDFRYPGPKPHCRETAVLMLADAVEAATRSLGKPTPSRIKEITKQIVDKRMLSGELDESNLTLSDLARIREAFIPLLTGIHHARIAYPGQRTRDAERPADRKTEKKAEKKAEKKSERKSDRKTEREPRTVGKSES